MIGQVFPEAVWSIDLFGAKVTIADTVVTTWGLILVLALLSYLLNRRLSLWHPTKTQLFAERVVLAIERSVAGTVAIPPRTLVPLIGTMWIFIGTMNLVSVVPYLHNPTRDLGTTAALALIAFGAIHYYGIRFAGLRRYLRHYVQPSALLLPFNLFSDVSRIFAMAIRLFGNMLSWELIIAILIALAGFLVPVPIMLLSIVGDLLHAYLFGLLTYIFIIGGIEAEQTTLQEHHHG
jgi:F-type H+-transporting ATPase subunit a